MIAAAAAILSALRQNVGSRARRDTSSPHQCAFQAQWYNGVFCYFQCRCGQRKIETFALGAIVSKEFLRQNAAWLAREPVPESFFQATFS